MTEAEWLTGREPYPMLRLVAPQASGRKLRLFACGCCRHWTAFRDDPVLVAAVDVGERYADGEIGGNDLPSSLRRHPDSPLTGAVLAERAFAAAVNVAYLLSYNRPELLVRDVFGNPFRPVTAEPRWLTSTAVGLAEGIYDGREFDRLPILADALEDAGCDNSELLAHCRGDGPHVRGCWTVDLVLGKE